MTGTTGSRTATTWHSGPPTPSGRDISFDEWAPRPITPDEIQLVKRLRAKATALKPGTRMLMSINDARELTRLAGVPMYRGRNSAYVSLTLFHVDKWLTFAEKSIIEAVAAKFNSL